MYKIFPYKDLDHREILQYGILFILMFILFLAVIRDAFILRNPINAITNSTSLLLTFVAYYILHFKKYKIFSAYLIMAIATIPLYFLIYINHFGNLPILYVIVLPLGTFFMLSFKHAMILNAIIFTALFFLVYVIYIEHPHLALFHNVPALFNIAFVSIMIMLFGIFYHLSVESFIKKLIFSNRQKEILLKEVHHRVKNNLNITSAMLGLQALKEDEEIKPHILKSKSRIQAISTVHEMLYKQKNYENILISEYLQRLEELFYDIYQIDNLYQFEIKIDKTLSLPLDIMVQFGLIFNEMFTNTLKYAQNPKKLIITVSMHRKDANTLEFIYKDNGINKVKIEELKNNKGLGMQLIELSAKQINAELSIYYKHGLNYRLRIKNV